MEAGPSNPKPKPKTDGRVDGRDAPWVEKYRPKTLDDVAAHKEIIDTSASANWNRLAAMPASEGMQWLIPVYPNPRSQAADS